MPSQSDIVSFPSADAVLELMRRAIRAAEGLGVRACVSVVDLSGVQVGSCRMSGALQSSDAVALGKAKAAVTFGTDTAALAASMSVEKMIQIVVSNGGRFVFIGGGRPITTGDSIVGGIGISGGSSLQDDEIAVATLSLVPRGLPDMGQQ